MKTALITGASRGIGRAVARELAHQGWAVGINYLNRADKARELVEELTAEGCHAAMFQADVADSAAVVLQINGKVREQFTVPAGLSKEELLTEVMSREATKKRLEGKEIVKTISVPGKLVNIVVKG